VLPFTTTRPAASVGVRRGGEGRASCSTAESKSSRRCEADRPGFEAALTGAARAVAQKKTRSDRSYRTAVFEPGLSASQRRLLL